MLTIAECLPGTYDVSIFWDDTTILKKARVKLGLQLQKVQVVDNIFSSHMPFFQRLLKTKDYDVIFFLSDGSLPISLAKKTFVHFQFPVVWVQGKTFANRLKLQQIAGVFCNSQFTKSFIDQTFGVDSRVIYPPCGSEKQTAAAEKRKDIILNVGRYSELPDGSSFKKQEFLITVFKEMVAKGLKNWHLVIATSFLPEEEKKVEKLVKAAEGYPITILKNISYEEMTKLYQTSKVYWHAAGYGINEQQHPEWVEHFGITTVEAMQSGLVPVVVHAGGQPEIVTDGVNGFLWKTKHELIKKTLQIITDEDLRKKMVVSAKKRAKNFSTEKFCRAIMELMSL